MLSINPSEMPPRDVYRLFISLLVPRPIAWVSTIGVDGSLNLAPYSFFNGVGGTPPTVMFSVSLRKGAIKDTFRNVQETGEFVLNLVDESLAEAMNLTSGEYAYEVDEFAIAGLQIAPSTIIHPPRVATSPAAMECKLTQLVPVEGTNNTLVIGRVVFFHLREGLLRSNGLVDSNLLLPLARLGGDEYGHVREVFTLPRPR
jgi:flavin reductase (DIM6/NTAB) family NADH-FMN oxidoreductase RutF